MNMFESFELILIRHGQTPGNAEKRYIGCTDESLSAKGRTELEMRMKRGVYPAAGSLYLSPMRRCIQTAEILYPGQKYTMINEFREMDFGRFEGKNYAELSGDPDYQAWIDSGGLIAFPGGESRAEFIRRSMRGFQKMMRMETGRSIPAGFQEQLSRFQKIIRLEAGSFENSFQRSRSADGKMPDACELREEDTGFCKSSNEPVRRITLIVHGGTIMAFLSALCGGDYWDYQVPNGGGYRVQLRPAAEDDRKEDIFCRKGAYAERIFALSHDRVCSGVCAGSDSGRSAQDAASGATDRTFDQRL